MGLFLDAAKAWDRLTNLRYDLTYGKSGKSYFIPLRFRPDEFPHLAGMQYAADVDFGLRASSYQGDKLLPKLLSGKLEDHRIEKSRNWEQIQGRLQAICVLEDILDHEFDCFLFHPKKLSFHSKITASYLFRSPHTGNTVFVFVSEEEECCFCQSIFLYTSRDYSDQQTRLTLLEKVKHSDSGSQLLFRSKSYQKNADA